MLKTSGSVALVLALVLALLVAPHALRAQDAVSIRAPGDTTLHGNPDCSLWLQLSDKTKSGWLGSILGPLNMTYLQREKPAQDRYGALPSLAPAVRFVDEYCAGGAQLKAMGGAMKYFDGLTGR